MKLPIGSRSVIFGTHCFLIHPWFVAAAWWKLYGFPKDIRLWIAFFVHDLGYWGKPNLDGPEGEKHVEWGAKFMHRWFDRKGAVYCIGTAPTGEKSYVKDSYYWHDFSLYHSRYYAKAHSMTPSRLCVADKLSITLEPWWLYLPRTKLSGELAEYMDNARRRAESNEKLSDEERRELLSQDGRRWFEGLKSYMRRWVQQHKTPGTQDTWTAGKPHD